MRELVERVVRGERLPREAMLAAMDAMLEGSASPPLIAAFLVALRMRGETATEIGAAAEALRRRAATVELALPEGTALLDTCGTGGDGAGSFNVSTVAALVAAAAGVKVVKHGNRAVSSRAGSADLLEALGVPLEADPARIAESVRRVGIGFFFAPQFHAAVRHVMPVRRELGFRTLFNLLGPLANPARATHQLLGVYEAALVPLVAEALLGLGITKAWVVHGSGGVDEVSTAGDTLVAEVASGAIRTFSLSPADAGLPLHPVAALVGGDAAVNARITRDVLAGAPSPYRDAVVLNAAAALVVAGRAHDLASAARLAADTLDGGKARETLASWVQVMGEPAPGGR